MLQTMIVEPLERVFDRYLLGSGTSSIRPEEEITEAVKNGAYILDVRTNVEAKKGTVPGATTIPLPILRRHLDELPHDRTIVTFCKTGGRAGRARDILDGKGFKVVNGGSYERILKIVQKGQAASA